jgi:nucleotide-binding universal stress UspA family protein
MRYLPRHHRAATSLENSPAAEETGPVLVAVDGSPASDQALEWAAAEAAARGVPLQIMYVYEWPLTFDPFGATYQWEAGLDTAREILGAALDQARVVAPLVQTTTHAVTGHVLGSILRQARDASLIVLGRAAPPKHRRWRLTLAARLARRTTTTLAVAGLAEQPVERPDAGHVMLALDGPGAHTAAVASAFRAAHRRGTHLIVVHMMRPERVHDADGTTKDSLLDWHGRYHHVAVQQRQMSARFGRALGARAAGTALLVVSESTSTASRLRTWVGFRGHTIGALLGVKTSGPVLILPPPPRGGW